MRRTKEQLEQLVELIKSADTAGWVCDAWQGCNDWQTHGQTLMEIGFDFFNFCPFCGKKLDWQKWERLKK